MSPQAACESALARLGVDRTEETHVQVFANINSEQLKSVAAKFGLTPHELDRVTKHDFGKGKITLVVYPGNPKQAEFLRHLVKEGHAFPDLSEPGRWELK